MSDYTGIWIDHSKAVIVCASGNGITTETVTSDVAGHPRFSGGRGSEGEKHYESRHGQELDRYYGDVINRIAEPDQLLILGPGEAKTELRERLTHVKAHAQCAVAVEAADKLTEPQIVARVKEHFGLAH